MKAYQTQLGHIIYTYNERCRKELKILLIITITSRTLLPKNAAFLGTQAFLLTKIQPNVFDGQVLYKPPSHFFLPGMSVFIHQYSLQGPLQTFLVGSARLAMSSLILYIDDSLKNQKIPMIKGKKNIQA